MVGYMTQSGWGRMNLLAIHPATIHRIGSYPRCNPHRYARITYPPLATISKKKLLAKELGNGNIRLSIRLWRILTAHDFDMGNIGYNRK